MGMNKGNVLITGGIGFIASHYARLLIQGGYNITIADKATYAADIKRIEDIRDEIDIYNVDICDEHLMKSIISDVDIVVNFAAETMVDRSIKDSREFIHSNIEGVRNLLDIAVGKDIDRFVQISTDECYGSTRWDDECYGSTRWDDESFKETDRLNPGNPYSASKASADLLCLSYWNTYGLDIVITRSSNNYGPWQHTEKFVPRMISLGLQEKDLEVYGKGNNVRDWLYVEDNCLGIKTVMENGKKGEIYNIGAGDEKTNNEIAEIISNRFGVRIKYIEDRKGHDFKYSINCNKIRNELDWEPMMEFEDGIERTIKFYEERNKE